MSTVIKAGQAGTLLRKLSTVDLADHLAEADAVVEAARRRATQIVSQAEGTTERERREAAEAGRGEGFEAGRAAGIEEGRKAAYDEATERFTAEQAQLISAMTAAIDAFEGIKQEVRIAAEHDVLELAVQIATKLTYDIGKMDHEAAKANLTRAVDLIGSKTDLTIRLHPEDADAMRTFAETVLTDADKTRSIRTVRDESIARGGCKVSSEEAQVDATLETQIAEMISLLLGRGASHG